MKKKIAFVSLIITLISVIIIAISAAMLFRNIW